MLRDAWIFKLKEKLKELMEAARRGVFDHLVHGQLLAAALQAATN
jgi:hypothetical protein